MIEQTTKKRALITGITGQDGSYMAEFLLGKGYEVHGIVRPASVFTTERIDHIFNNQELNNKIFFTIWGDLTDSSNLNRILEKTQPHEIYNLAAQSHVKVSFDIPEYTAEVDAIGTLRILDAIKELGLNTKFYQASTSELFGKAREIPQTERTPFYPRSPYAAAKLFAHWVVINYREAYDLFACNGILFNHESPRRGKTFVTRKIAAAAVNIKLGRQDKLYLGNLNARRDWGYAPEYVEAMWLMLQQDKPDDYVIATGENHTVREFCEVAFNEVGIVLEWEGEGIYEKGVDRKTGKVLVEVDPVYFRRTEVDVLLGNSEKAKRKLGWTPKTTFEEIIKIMVHSELENNNNGRTELTDSGKTYREEPLPYYTAL